MHEFEHPRHTLVRAKPVSPGHMQCMERLTDGGDFGMSIDGSLGGISVGNACPGTPGAIPGMVAVREKSVSGLNIGYSAVYFRSLLAPELLMNVSLYSLLSMIAETHSVINQDIAKSCDVPIRLDPRDATICRDTKTT